MQTGVATATQGHATLFTTTDSVGSTAEAKLLSYLDASPSTSKVGAIIIDLRIISFIDACFLLSTFSFSEMRAIK